MKTIILAGGFATRLWPLTENKAKPLLHLKDKMLISHITDGLPRDMEIIISTNAVFEEEFKKWAKGYSDRPITVFVEDSDSDEFKKGALGATALVIEQLKIHEDLMLIAGDNYFGFKMEHFIDTFKNNPLLAVYDIGDLDSARKFGVVVTKSAPPLSDGRPGLQVSEFQEKPQKPKSTLVSTGCYIFPAGNLEDLVIYAKEKNDDLGGIFEYLLQKGETIDVFSFNEKWFDVGSFDGYLNANKVLLDNQIIENGTVNLQLRSDNISKGDNNKLIGGVFLGDNVTVTNSIIEDSVILKNCNISNCVIRNCIVDEGCKLSNIDLSHKMIRQGSIIEK